MFMKPANTKIWGILLVYITVTNCSYGDINDDLKEVNTKFTYHGKPIHPAIIEEFSPWLSDPDKPITITLDVAAAEGTNEYLADNVEVKDNGYVFYRHQDKKECFYYKWLGELNDHLHVLEVGEGGGGSGDFKSLFFVRFDVGEGYMPEGKKYARLLISIVRNYALGDKDKGEIKLLANHVVIGKSQYRSSTIMLDF
jgi:hypothetical protein